MRLARCSMVGAAALLVAAALPAAPEPSASEPTASDYAADARSIEALVNAKYAYLDRFPGGRMPMTAKLRAEAEKVTIGRELVRYSERALALLADHHAITGSSTKDSRAVFPSYGDLWVEPRGGDFVIEAVRAASPAEGAGIRIGDRLLAIDGIVTSAAVAAYWADLGTTGGESRDGYAARVLAAGRRDGSRSLTIGHVGASRNVTLPSLYSLAQVDRPTVTVNTAGRDLIIKFNDSLGRDSTIADFDQAMAWARPGQRVVIDLTDSPSGGNTVIARAIIGWFVDKPTFYQVHNLPAEERETGIARQWAEQVLPRPGKRHRGPVVVRVGRWTGSMGEGLAIGFDAIGARVEGDRMAGLLGAIYDYSLEKTGDVVKLPTERLSAVDGTPREDFVPLRPRQ